MRKLLSIFLFIGLFLISMNVMSQQIQPNWTAPSKYKNIKGQGDQNIGKELYMKNCKSCHGQKGLGDGPKSVSLKTFPGNFTDKKFQSHTDGEIYFISFVGYNEMPNFEKKIMDDGDRWSIVSYIRTFKK